MFEHSDSISNLATGLAAAQADITAAEKNATNPFFKSKYADLDSVWSAIRKPLTSNGLSVIQAPETTDGEFTMMTMLCHKSGEWVKNSFTFPLGKSDIQGLGSAITYARRYGLCAIVGVTADEDDDGNNAPKPAQKKTAAQPQSSVYTQTQTVPAKPAGIPTEPEAFLKYVNQHVEIKYTNVFHLLNAIKQTAPKFDWPALATVTKSGETGAEKAFNIAVEHAANKKAESLTGTLFPIDDRQDAAQL